MAPCRCNSDPEPSQAKLSFPLGLGTATHDRSKVIQTYGCWGGMKPQLRIYSNQSFHKMRFRNQMRVSESFYLLLEYTKGFQRSTRCRVQHIGYGIEPSDITPYIRVCMYLFLDFMPAFQGPTGRNCSISCESVIMHMQATFADAPAIKYCLYRISRANNFRHMCLKTKG